MSGRNVPNYATLTGRFIASRQWDRVLRFARKWLSVEPENVEAHRRLSLRVRLIIFATFLAAFWGGSTLFLLNRYSSSIKHTWNILWGHPIRSGFIAYGCCLFFCLIAYFFMKFGLTVGQSRSESCARRRTKIFGTLLEPEPDEAETSPDEEPAEKPVVVETEPVRFRPDWADFP
jgi:hypothetical protein